MSTRRYPRGSERALRPRDGHGSTLSCFRRIIAEVPRGRVITYGQVAEAAGFPGAARLTVRALQSGEGLPWHRVVAAGGRIALPGEEGREQRLRLKMEGVRFRGGKVRMEVHDWTPRRRARRRTRRNRTRPRPTSRWLGFEEMRPVRIRPAGEGAEQWPSP